ncbi:ste14p [Phaffia rhodozyma]|uniref:Protein-S-isoprenylcysteine O-methyltransferase n=1 Tax=Phaffia rhodozyma TaxID=264483 RepID=A0A0F7SV90_PHARH|nr:ste14p [Phaffia rhodozyma]
MSSPSPPSSPSPVTPLNRFRKSVPLERPVPRADPTAAIAFTAFVLGSGFSLALALTVPLLIPDSIWSLVSSIEMQGRRLIRLPTSALPAYVAAWCLFHTLEYLVTAIWNPSKVYWGSFLLSNGMAYNVASSLVIVEYVVESYFFPSLKTVGWWTYLGLSIVVVGQSLRSLAMIQASVSFSHHVAFRKKDDHVLVKTGLYAYARHPSYMAFWWWAVGTQIMTANPIMLTLFAVLLWRWFFKRIGEEEFLLVRFFGQEYIEYRKKVTSGLPLLR